MRKSKQMITSYAEGLELFRTHMRKFWFGVLVIVLIATPWAALGMGGDYLLYVLNLAGIAVIVALGLNLLTGSAGLVSLGQAAFLAIGAYTAGLLSTRLGLPFWLVIPLAAGLTALVGALVGLPALRMKGVYLALATLAAQFIVEHLIVSWESLTGGPNGLAVAHPALGAFPLDTHVRFYYLIAGFAVLLSFGVANIMRSRIGRALVAIRDSDLAAQAMGVNLAKYKTLAFAISAGYAGVAGALYAFCLGYIGPDHFTIFLSVEYIVTIIVGGLGTILGSILGGIFVTLLPEGLRLLEGALKEAFPRMLFPDVKNITLGAVLILVILFEPQGLAGRWRKIKRYWTNWPF